MGVVKNKKMASAVQSNSNSDLGGSAGEERSVYSDEEEDEEEESFHSDEEEDEVVDMEEEDSEETSGSTPASGEHRTTPADSSSSSSSAASESILSESVSVQVEEDDEEVKTDVNDVVLQIDGEHEHAQGRDDDIDSMSVVSAVSDNRSEISEVSRTPRRREGIVKRWSKALFGKKNRTPKSAEKK